MTLAFVSFNSFWYSSLQFFLKCKLIKTSIVNKFNANVNFLNSHDSVNTIESYI